VTAHSGRAALAAALAGLALAGCAVGPRYRVPDVAAPRAWAAIAQGASTAASSAPDLREWWKGLGDPALSMLVDEALRGAPDLQLARAKLRAARELRAAAGADRFPSVTGSASASRSTAGTRVPTTLESAGFDASWELDLFGGVRRGVEAAQADLEVSEATAQDAQVTLVAEVASDYCDVRAAQARLAIARRSAESQAQTLQLTEWRSQAGLVSAQDVDQARANLETTRAQLPALELSLAQSEHQLDVLLGQAPGSVQARLATPANPAVLPAVPAQLAVGIPADALRHRPDVRAAERRLAAETARTGVAEAARYPTLKLSRSIGVEALTPGGLLRNESVFSSLIAGLTAPIFDAGKLRAQAQAQDAVREQAEVQYRQAVLGALKEVEDALWAMARDRDRAEALARAASSAGAAAQLAEQRYAAGLVDFTPVLDAQRTALGAEDGLASTRADEVKALIQLYKAMGGGWSSQALHLADREGEDTP
jgi:NodT family efflux transporter outer membrane factor (OMF) lipoprotein